MVDSVLSKLLAADSDLESQEKNLVAQLEALQAKRSSLQSVMEIFEPDKTAAAASPPVEADKVKPSQVAEAEAAPSPQKAASAKAAQPRKPAARSKAVRRGWQKYVRDEHGQKPLPEIVAGILQSKPKKMFAVAEVINAIVSEDIPATTRKDARNRISNILAEGARKKQWGRPKQGCYRFPK